MPQKDTKMGRPRKPGRAFHLYIREDLAEEVHRRAEKVGDITRMVETALEAYFWRSRPTPE